MKAFMAQTKKVRSKAKVILCLATQKVCVLYLKVSIWEFEIRQKKNMKHS